MDVKVKKVEKALKGIIEIPSDKSISHRAAILSSLCWGSVKIKNFSSGADCHSTLNVIKNLGCDIKFKNEKFITINSPKNFIKSYNALDCGNSGTTMRLMSGVLASQNFQSILIGDESLSKRPMKRVIEPLCLMGAEIFHDNFKAPLKINGKKLSAINYNSKLASAQVKSCILLAGLNTEGKTCFTEPYKSRNHTELMLKFLGANIHEDNTSISIEKSVLQPKDITIVGDISSAAFFMVAAAIVPNSEIILKNVGLNPTRIGIITVMEKMGTNIEILNKNNVSGEDFGDIKISYSELKGVNISGEIIPKLIDELPIIAVLASQAEGQTIVKDAQDLRNKEADRIKCLVLELKKIGVNIEETQDGFIVNGKTALIGGCEVECYHDHRLAMSLYVAGLICKNSLTIKEFQWVNISFPEFLQLMSVITFF